MAAPVGIYGYRGSDSTGYTPPPAPQIDRRIQEDIANLDKSLKSIFFSLLAIRNRHHSLSLIDIEDTLKEVKSLETAKGIDITLDEEQNMIQMHSAGWEFKAQAVGFYGSSCFRATLSKQGTFFSCSLETSNASYEKMVRLMHKLSLLSESDQMKLTETLHNPWSIVDVTDAIDSIVLQPESSSLELRREVLEEQAQKRRVELQEAAELQQRIAGRVKWSHLKAYIQANHSFPVYDWDANRGGVGLAGRYFLATMRLDLTGLRVEEIAQLFQQIMQLNDSVTVKDQTFTATSLHLTTGEGDTIADETILFIYGNPI